MEQDLLQRLHPLKLNPRRAREARPWLIGSVIVMVLTGIPLLASLAFSKYYFNEAFRLQMYFLLAALIFTFAIRQRIALGDQTRANSRTA